MKLGLIGADKVVIPNLDARKYWCLKCGEYKETVFRMKDLENKELSKIFQTEFKEVYLGIPLKKVCITCSNEKLGQAENPCGAV